MIRRWSYLISYNNFFFFLRKSRKFVAFHFFRKHVLFRKFKIKKTKIKRKVLLRFKKSTNWTLYHQIWKSATRNYKWNFLLFKMQYYSNFLKFSFHSFAANRQKIFLKKRRPLFWAFATLTKLSKLYTINYLRGIAHSFNTFTATNTFTRLSEIFDLKPRTTTDFLMYLTQQKNFFFLTPLPEKIYKKLFHKILLLKNKNLYSFLIEFQKILKLLIYKLITLK